MADEKKVEWKELLKYPILGVTIVFCLWLAKVLCILDVSNISKIGTDGVEFRDRTEKLAAQVAPFENRIKVLEVALETILNNKDTSTTVAVRNTILEKPEELQLASDKATQISEMKEVTSNTKVLEGWIWLGNYEKSRKAWSTLLLNEVDKSTVPTKIDTMVTYTLDGNMILRSENPTIKTDYFRSVPSLGIIPRGSTVTLISKPKPASERSVVQYWAKVRWTK